jgi:nucleotide-binding universal stress UspA family protein
MESQLMLRAMSGLGVYRAGWVAASLMIDRLDVALCRVTTSKIGQPRRVRNRPRSAHGLSPKGMDKLIAEAKRAAVYTRGLLLDGIPAQLVRVARSAHTGMIAMETHGRAGFARLFIGSVAQQVVGAVPCPALTVRCRCASVRRVRNPR